MIKIIVLLFLVIGTYMYVFLIDKSIRYGLRKINKKKKQTIWHPMKTRNQFLIDRDMIFCCSNDRIILNIFQIVNKSDLENSSIFISVLHCRCWNILVCFTDCGNSDSQCESTEEECSVITTWSCPPYSLLVAQDTISIDLWPHSQSSPLVHRTRSVHRPT